MADKKEKKEIKEKKVAPVGGFYKGYEMRWLKKETKHPEYYLVAEYEAEYGEIK